MEDSSKEYHIKQPYNRYGIVHICERNQHSLHLHHAILSSLKFNSTFILFVTHNVTYETDPIVPFSSAAHNHTHTRRIHMHTPSHTQADSQALSRMCAHSATHTHATSRRHTLYTSTGPYICTYTYMRTQSHATAHERIFTSTHSRTYAQ